MSDQTAFYILLAAIWLFSSAWALASFLRECRDAVEEEWS